MSMNAIFCFTIVKKLSLQSLEDIVSKAVTVADVSHTFKEFRVYVEEDKIRHVKVNLPHQDSVGDHEGWVSSVDLSQLKTWLNNKRVSEERARTQPGHTSYRPPKLLDTNTCVVVIGSRAYCAYLARIHMEEIVTLRSKLVDILTGVCELRFYTPKSRISHDDILITSVRPDAKDHITYNLNWMADQVIKVAERPSHESVMRRLGLKT